MIIWIMGIMGHLPKDRMLVMLKAARAQGKVLRYIRDELHCEECMRQKREIRRRAAAYPRTFDFNRIIGVDSGGHILHQVERQEDAISEHRLSWLQLANSLVRPFAGGEPLVDYI